MFCTLAGSLVVSALLNSQYTEFHLECRLRPMYTVRWLLTSDTPEPPLKITPTNRRLAYGGLLKFADADSQEKRVIVGLA
jgi:hypothetical protein